MCIRDRVYADRPVTREQLVHLVDVARFAPSACNSQPWHFILVDVYKRQVLAFRQELARSLGLDGK